MPPRIAVVIPCYRVRDQIAGVLKSIGPEVWRIYCIDDACPDHSGCAVQAAAAEDPRVHLLVHETNQGVGGAVVTGYQRALRDGAEILVKIDGDGQMDPRRIKSIVEPIAQGAADYVKGNRFFNLEGLKSMPLARLIGNAGLSFFSKLSTGYWNLFDPTNGYTAIHASVARAIPMDKLSRRYFFESDMLFRLNTLRAVVTEIPMNASYSDEKSSMNLWRILVTFPFCHVQNYLKRVFYSYFLRNFSVASVDLIVGALLLLFGTTFGAYKWYQGIQLDTVTTPGTVMLAALPVILGIQLLLSFLSIDIASVPGEPIHKKLSSRFDENRRAQRGVVTGEWDER